MKKIAIFTLVYLFAIFIFFILYSGIWYIYNDFISAVISTILIILFIVYINLRLNEKEVKANLGVILKNIFIYASILLISVFLISFINNDFSLRYINWIGLGLFSWFIWNILFLMWWMDAYIFNFFFKIYMISLYVIILPKEKKYFSYFITLWFSLISIYLGYSFMYLTA